MGLFSSITRLFRKYPQVDECCADGVCTCSSDGNDLVSGTAVSINTDTSLKTVELESDSCCRDGVCTCSSDGNDDEIRSLSGGLVSDSPVVTTTSTSPSSEVTFSSQSDRSSSTVVTAEKLSVTATSDEINIALETAVEADKISAESYTPTVPPPKKMRSNSKKTSSKLNRKSSGKRKKN